MNLAHIKEKTCPHCGSVAICEKRSSQKHTNGFRSEEREFDCGAVIRFSPNYVGYDNCISCPYTPDNIKNRQKENDLIRQIEEIVDSADVSRRFKEKIIFYLPKIK